MHRSVNIWRFHPCVCCDYPVSQRHHLLPFAEYGENPSGVNLCANCHEAVHLCQDFMSGEARKQSNELWQHLMLKLGGVDNPLVLKIVEIACVSLGERGLLPEAPGSANTTLDADECREEITRDALSTLRPYLMSAHKQLTNMLETQREPADDHHDTITVHN